jgi:hypothetical protein
MGEAMCDHQVISSKGKNVLAPESRRTTFFLQKAVALVLSLTEQHAFRRRVQRVHKQVCIVGTTALWHNTPHSGAFHTREIATIAPEQWLPYLARVSSPR